MPVKISISASVGLLSDFFSKNLKGPMCIPSLCLKRSPFVYSPRAGNIGQKRATSGRSIIRAEKTQQFGLNDEKIAASCALHRRPFQIHQTAENPAFTPTNFFPMAFAVQIIGVGAAVARSKFFGVSTSNLSLTF
ncbi:hypothetical protein PSQ90_07780 [Devosia rhodophyticola]|uniref:Uncharacterized protein n=1 Tax=Devosia rhodophyticola TaxID=3026423 RepID=A0ABY7Z223_9HYPH|nr:hypothetical protein [Devosia rhodophyticola]WDR07612.1 hypothetical protein PSQ90_07780 [Devosia rhodophyticola]